MKRDTSDFEPRLGRIRDSGRGSAARAKSVLDQVLRVATKANGGPLTPAQMRGEKRWGGGSPRKGRCSRIGRDQAAADALKRHAAERGGPRPRRVVVKARIVRHKARLRRGGRTPALPPA